MAQTLTTLQEKIEWLFKNNLHPEGKEYTLREVAEEMERLGHPVSHQALWKVRTGKARKTSIDFLSALAKVFGVPLTYFSDHPIPVQEQERLRQAWFSGGADTSTVALRAARNPHTEEITRRVDQLNDQNKQIVLAVIKQIAALEGISEDSTDVALDETAS